MLLMYIIIYTYVELYLAFEMRKYCFSNYYKDLIL